jgi:hypothetical protein
MVNQKIKELSTILIAIIVLSLIIIFNGVRGETNFIKDFPPAFISFFIIISVSIFAKKIVAYHYEADITTKFWEFYRYGLQKGHHLKKSTPMVWLPIMLSLFSRGTIWWLGILEFDIKPRPERVSKRHGLYRFSEITEWNIAIISMWGVIACLILSTIGYIAGFEAFARIATFYAAWSIIPISTLDGTKIFFGSRGIWSTITIITGLFLVAAFTI